MRSKFNLDTIQPYDRAVLLLCCEGFVAQQNAIFAELHRVLAAGGQVEIAIPVGAADQDLTQAILFFSETLDGWEQTHKPEQSAPSIEFCRCVLEALLAAALMRKKAENAIWN